MSSKFIREYERRLSAAETIAAGAGSGKSLEPTPRRRKVRVLGVDTSLRSTGVGVLDGDGSAMRIVSCGTIRCPAKLSLSECLTNLSEKIKEVIDGFSPEEVAVEGIFHYVNIKSALALAHARGVVLEICAAHNLPVYEYPPRRVKQAVVGTGSATKNQIQKMVASALCLEELPQEDAADALAIAMTHIHARLGVSPLVRI